MCDTITIKTKEVVTMLTHRIFRVLLLALLLVCTGWILWTIVSDLHLSFQPFAAQPASSGWTARKNAHKNKSTLQR